MNIFKLIASCSILFTALFFMGCGSSSELEDTWSDSSYKEPAIKKILVISIGKDPVKRRIWEDLYCTQLKKHHVTATPSYRLFPEVLPDTDQVKQIIRSTEFDGVLVNRWIPSGTKSRYVMGTTNREQRTVYSSRWNRFVTYYQEVYHPGYIDTQTIDFRTIDLWVTGSEGKMIWGAVSRTPEPNSSSEVRPDIVELVMDDLTAKGKLSPEK